MKYLKEIKQFIGTAKYDEWGGGYIWGYDKDDSAQMVGQINKPNKIQVNEVLSVRGWGAIINMFPDIESAAEFQDELGKFIAEAINEKLERL